MILREKVSDTCSVETPLRWRPGPRGLPRRHPAPSSPSDYRAGSAGGAGDPSPGHPWPNGERFDTSWDVVVIGAGPAGAMAAREVARRGVGVLLVDQSSFPRQKVCGCCFNGAALGTLEAVGLGELPARCGAQPLRAMQLAAGRWQATIALPRSVALSRETFDAALVEHAVRAGATFLPQTHATVGGLSAEHRDVTLSCAEREVTIAANVVLVAAGLGTRLFEGDDAFHIDVARHSRIGLGAVLDEAPDWYHRGTIFMARGQFGYVGLVRLEDGRLDIAAACDPMFVRAARGPGNAVRRLLDEVGWPCPVGVLECAWRGTPWLTRRRKRLGAQRLFLIGDAASYVEPFTGEGIAWALASGAAVAPLAARAARRWDTSFAAQWTAAYARLIQRRQRACRLVSGVLRRTDVTAGIISLLSRMPHLAAPFVRAVNAPFPIPAEAPLRDAR